MLSNGISSYTSSVLFGVVTRQLPMPPEAQTSISPDPSVV